MYIIPLTYLAAVSVLAVVLTGYDKNAAKKQKWRIKERILIIVALLGGSVAMLLTMWTIRHKTKHIKFMMGISIIIMLQAAICILVFNTSLSVNHHTLKTDKITAPIKLALVTDLHSCAYGREQSNLINTLLNEQPDVALLVGDIFDDDISPENTIKFIDSIADKIPCYYVTGNHEFWSGKADEFKDIMLSYDVKVLEGSYEDVKVRGEKIRICGIDDPHTDRYPSRAISYTDQLQKLNGASSNEIYTILLAHRPERIDEYLSLNVDLVLSGHAHGGQWRIPLILENGLFAPNQGLSPKYSSGLFLFDATTMIVSRGLAKETTKIPRIFNQPELVILTLE